jgi:asparagine synthase (glutamine-hydrolysing)
MILAVFGKELIGTYRQKLNAVKQRESSGGDVLIHTDEVWIWTDSLDRSERDRHVWINDNGKAGCVWTGALYHEEFLPFRKGGERPAKVLWEKMENQGPGFLSGLNGDFVLLTWGGRTGEVRAAGDRIGVCPVYYGESEKGWALGSRPGPVAELTQSGRRIHMPAVMRFLAFCYNPGRDTFFTGVRRLRPAHFLAWKPGESAPVPVRYWSLEFRVSPIEEREAADAVREKMSRAVHRRMDSRSSTGAFLSGGLDSSSVVSLLHRHGGDPLSTFSFRCKGIGFDESPYARRVAESVGSVHRLVEYPPEAVRLAEEMTGLMDDPFCDVGINVATYLLSKEARGKVDLLFTGDGGDELFAGHPVYTADRVDALIKWIPGIFLAPVYALGRRFSDSDRKKDWRVKVQRFSISARYPHSLGTHRWRVYYRPEDLTRLLLPDLHGFISEDTMYGDVIAFNREARGQDSLSRTLYSDYQTVVQFYLRRMGMAGRMGLKPRFPMLDPDLVEYCATLPAGLKIRGLSDTKVIEKTVAEPLLPREVVFRKDKLGHSIPLKNWMRDNRSVREMMDDLLSPECVKNRGYMSFEYVDRMKREHDSRRANHSHRLWALMILELWMRQHMDGGPAWPVSEE